MLKNSSKRSMCATLLVSSSGTSVNGLVLTQRARFEQFTAQSFPYQYEAYRSSRVRLGHKVQVLPF